MQVEKFVREEEKQIVHQLKKKIEALAARERNSTQVILFKIDKLVLIRVLFAYLDLDSINRLGASCWPLRRLIYSPCGLKLITRLNLKNYSEKVSNDILAKVNTVIKNLQKSAQSHNEPNSLGESKKSETEGKSLYGRLMGYSNKKPKAENGEEKAEVLKYQEELAKELESVRSLKQYLHDQVDLMKTTLSNNESASKRNLNENKQLSQQNDELNFRLLEAKDNVKQLNSHYQQYL